MAKISIDNPPLEVLLAMQDDQFREILKNDEVLNRLEEEKNNKQAEYFELMSIISKRFKICGLRVIPITPAIWSLLYVLGNRYALNERPVTREDTAVFIYLLAHGMDTITDTLYSDALTYFEEKHINELEA